MNWGDLPLLAGAAFSVAAGARFGWIMGAEVHAALIYRLDRLAWRLDPEKGGRP